MKSMTLCFPVRGDPIREVLLGYKKTGFGQGKYTGFGGKVEIEETIAAAAVRELAEETGLSAASRNLKPAGWANFIFPFRPEWSQRVSFFLVWQWHGEVQESREMAPHWFQRDQAPFDKMWADAAYWLPPILEGKIITADFSFQEDHETLASVKLHCS